MRFFQTHIEIGLKKKGGGEGSVSGNPNNLHETSPGSAVSPPLKPLSQSPLPISRHSPCSDRPVKEPWERCLYGFFIGTKLGPGSIEQDTVLPSKPGSSLAADPRGRQGVQW